MAIALLTNYLAPYRVPLYERLAARHEIEVLCYGGGDRYVPPWFSDLDRQLASARFPARRLAGPREALAVARRHDTLVVPFAGGAILPAAYAGARLRGRRFVLWASVWREPRSPVHLLSRPAIHHIYRRSDAVLAYGEHVRRFVTAIRGREDGVLVAPQSVEAEVFARRVPPAEIEQFRSAHRLEGPFVLYAGRLVPEKGIGVLLEAWASLDRSSTLVLIGDGPLAARARAAPRTAVLDPLPRPALAVAYAAAELAVLASIPTPRFLEPWGLVCNEAMHQGKPVVASAAVGAVAGGLVQDGATGLVVPPQDPDALGGAIDRLLSDSELRGRLGRAALAEVAAYSYDAMVEAFERALAAVG